MDDELDDGSFSGTFRWSKGKKLNSLPQLSSKERFSDDLIYSDWLSYFKSRAQLAHFQQCRCGIENQTFCKYLSSTEKKLIDYVRTDLAIIDCLSTPLTIAYIIKRV